MEEMLSIISVIIYIPLILLLLYFYYFILFKLPASMAKQRGRNPVGWTILFWILTPFWGAILLLILGDSKEKIKQDILDEINNNQHPPTYE